MKIKGKQFVTIEIDKYELSCAIMQVVREKLRLDTDFDDAGMDWYTSCEENGKVFIGDKNWCIADARHFSVAILVDSANILRYGETLKLEE